MANDPDIYFHRRRADQERAAAERIHHNRSAIAHLALAELHAERASQLAASRAQPRMTISA